MKYKFAALSDREKMVVNAKRDQHRKTFKELFGPDKDEMTFETEQKLLEKRERLEKELDPFFPPTEFMASGGRPGLYANINAKRKRIAAGSGEKMRKKGDKGAPTAANFRESAKTAKKANGGGLNYMNGYYGKSYK